MAEFVLIDEITQQTENNTDEYNTYYVRLAVEEESQLAIGAFTPTAITVEEGFGNAFIQCKVVFTDTFGSLINAKPIEGDHLFTLYVGRNPESYQQYKLKLKSYRIYNQSIGESADYQVEIILISDYWQEIQHNKKVKSWRNLKYSEVVQEIIDECGIENSLVSDTKKTQPTIIRPYWTNNEMLNWITERSRGANGDTFFTYAALPNNSFFFCTFSDLIDNAVIPLLDFQPQDPREFTLSGENPDGDDGSRRRLMNFRVLTDYADEMSRGASGINYGYYDYDTRSYVKSSHTFSESAEKQLSDWSMVSEDQETIGTFYFGHRDKETTENIVRSKVSKEVNKILNVLASTRGTTDVQVGEVIRLTIPVNPEHFDLQFNEFFSGRYVVSHKKTMCDLENDTAETILRFTRQGLNGPETDALVESQVGKV